MTLRILVTGGAGFIGSNLIVRLISIGHEVHSLDNYSTGSSKNEYDGCTYVEGDVQDIAEIFDEQFDVIFHLAALARIQPSFQNPVQVFDANVTGTHMVLEYARQTGAKVVFAGSSSRWHDPAQSPYAMSKYVGEQLCQMYVSSYKMNVHIARFYNVYGPGEITDGDYATVIGIWRKKRAMGEPLPIYGDGEQRRDFTHVFDICDGLCRIMETESATREWELGTGVNYSINQLADMFGVGINRVYLSDKPHNYRETLRKNDAALEELGWKPEDRIQEYLRGAEPPVSPLISIESKTTLDAVRRTPDSDASDTGAVLDERCNIS
jgi:UDP-glucose 4-epimerase